MVKFSDQKCLVYHCTFVMQPCQHQTSIAQMAQHTKCARKGKRKGREREKKRRKKFGIKSQKRKKKKKKHLHGMHIHFPTMTPLPWPFMSVKIWQCLIVKNNISILFSSKLCLIIISCVFLCWIPEVNIQPYSHFGCIFQNFWPF